MADNANFMGVPRYGLAQVLTTTVLADWESPFSSGNWVAFGATNGSDPLKGAASGSGSKLRKLKITVEGSFGGLTLATDPDVVFLGSYLFGAGTSFSPMMRKQFLVGGLYPSLEIVFKEPDEMLEPGDERGPYYVTAGEQLVVSHTSSAQGVYVEGWLLDG